MIRLIITIGKLIYLQSFSLITIGIYPSVEKYVEIERKDATEPVMKAGIALLKKNSAIETRMKHAMICCRVLLTPRYSVIRVMPTKQPSIKQIEIKVYP